MEFIHDIYGYMKERKKFWLLPIILTMLVIGGILVASSGTAVAPFIYTLF